VSRLVKEGIIVIIKAGRAYLCTLNLENEKALALLQLSEIEKRYDFYQRDKELGIMLEDFASSLEPKSSMLSIVLFGSYAKGSAGKESDIDILLLTKGGLNIEKASREIYAKYGKEINPIVMTANDFRKQKGKALIKEIVSSHYVLYGADNFIKAVFK
jgi:predicted nucleotidyltransferase